ncbi:MAG: hypothetical protein IJ351_05530, partial [Oscillospiraceae bacterium]|nr:hypothetical protein [Oscillospiraceae bacterium]
DKLLFEVQLRICHLPLPMGEVPPKGGGEGIVIFLKKITSPQAITTHFSDCPLSHALRRASSPKGRARSPVL